MENIDEEIENIIKETNISDEVIVEDVIENFEDNINDKKKIIVDKIILKIKKINIHK